MRILVGVPVPLTQVAGPSTVARDLIGLFEKEGDSAFAVTASPFERLLPPPLRQVVLLVRAIPNVLSADALLLLDPASTGPSLALLAKLFGKRSVLRVGGDSLWEMYVERTQVPLTLSEFHAHSRQLSFHERGIKSATALTLRVVGRIAFTTTWQRDLWAKAYALDEKKCVVVAPALPAREPEPARNKVFLAAHRGMRIKNGEILDEVWKKVTEHHPEAVLDTTVRPREEYHKAMQDCYAVIVPSLSEVSPNAVFEAIRYGKPFIAMKDTGVYEDLQELGGFVDTKDATAIADAVGALLDPTEYERRVERILSFARVRSWEEVARDYRALLAA